MVTKMRLNMYGVKFGNISQNCSICNVANDTFHIVLHCPKFSIERNNCYQTLENVIKNWKDDNFKIKAIMNLHKYENSSVKKDYNEFFLNIARKLWIHKVKYKINVTFWIMYVGNLLAYPFIWNCMRKLWKIIWKPQVFPYCYFLYYITVDLVLNV